MYPLFWEKKTSVQARSPWNKSRDFHLASQRNFPLSTHLSATFVSRCLLSVFVTFASSQTIRRLTVAVEGVGGPQYDVMCLLSSGKGWMWLLQTKRNSHCAFRGEKGRKGYVMLLSMIYYSRVLLRSHFIFFRVAVLCRCDSAQKKG